MKMRRLRDTIATTLFIATLTAGAQSPVMDGDLDAAFYGAPASVQDTPTAFGDATNGNIRIAIGGSELDAAYARISDGYLFLFIAGNVETAGQGVQFPTGNPNRLDIFVDSIPGGQNSLRGDNADVDSGGLNRMGHLNPENDGLKFDTNMVADFFFTFHNFTYVQDFGPGYGQREVWRGQLWYATVPTEGNGIGMLLGTAADTFPNSYPPEFLLSRGVRLGFHNTNKGGVTGSGAPSPSVADATNVTTGLELAIPVSLLAAADGSLNPEIRIMAFINDAYHGYLSNQTLGPMGQPAGGYGNLGEPRTFNFAESYSPNDQYFTVGNPYRSAREMFLPVLLDGGVVSNNWLAEPGLAYELQASTNLLAPAWQAVGNVTTAAVALMTQVETNAAGARYYRTLQQ